jgi:NitT/TauT family transport system permease protein
VTGARVFRWIVPRLAVNLTRLAIVAVVLLAWQYLPHVSWLRHRSPVFDPFFVSSPVRVFHRLEDVMTASHGQPDLWPYLWQTLEGTFIGVAIGTVGGALLGLVFSNSPRLSRTLSPFVTLLNATPRIALVPIFVIIAGPSLTSSALTAIFVVFFLVFYNAFNGGGSVPREVVQNAQLLGASDLEVMSQIRLPYVLVWTFASLPNAISFGLVAVVTAEILTGTPGMGRLLSSSIDTVDATLTFTVVVVLTFVGVTLVTLAEVARRKTLHWWVGGS